MISRIELFNHFQVNPEAQQALQAAEQIIARRLAIAISDADATAEMEQLLSNNALEHLLTGEIAEWDYCSPLAILNRIIQQEIEESENNFFQVSRLSEIESLPPFATHVHLKKQPVINIAGIEALLNHCPQLKVIQVPPGYDHLLFGTARSACAQKGVQIRVGRLKESTYDTRKYGDEEKFAQELTLFKEVCTTRAAELELMHTHNFPEYQLAAAYYGASPRRSVRALAEEFGIDFSLARERLNRFKAWMGVESNSKQAQSYRDSIAKRISDIQAELEHQTSYQHLQHLCRVDDFYPPTELAQKYWHIWTQLQSMESQGGHLATQFPDLNPDILEQLRRYFQISEYYNEAITQPQLALETGVTRQAIHFNIVSYLNKLGVILDRENYFAAQASSGD